MLTRIVLSGSPPATELFHNFTAKLLSHITCYSPEFGMSQTEFVLTQNLATGINETFLSVETVRINVIAEMGISL